MKTVLDTATMHPWREINRMLQNARSLTVKAGGRTYEGEAVLEDAEGDGHLVLTFTAKHLVKAKK